MIYCFDKYRKKNGYIKLDDIEKEKLSVPVDGFRKNKEWFLIDGTSYLFKGNNGLLEDIKELLNELMARELGIENAQYDLAEYQGKKGVLSPDFSNGKPFKPMLNYLCKINNLSNDLYTYVLFLCFRDLNELTIKRNIKFWLYSHILDIFTCQRDRHFNNLALFEEGLLSTPRYDSAGSFLFINNPNKIYKFIKSPSRKELIARYGGVRTKFRIFPGNVMENSIDELLEAYYVSADNPYVISLIREALLDVSKVILSISQIDFNALYYELEESNIILSSFYRDFFRMIVDFKMEEYIQKKGESARRLIL